MRDQRLKKWSFLLATAAALLGATPAAAQISGELVQPGVMILLDSSGSMDWRRGQLPAGFDNKWEWSEDACNADDASAQTGWQIMSDALLGGIDSNYRCSVEPSDLRPMLAPLDRDVLGPNLPDWVSEFREVFWSHYRAVGCDADKWHRVPGGSFDQCIGTSPSTDGNIQEVTTGAGPIYCRTDDYEYNTCWNYHPAARNRAGNGILDRYEEVAKFGIMTLDTMPNCLGDNCDDHDHLWNYGVTRRWECQGDRKCYWNAGGRGDFQGAVGGLVRIGLTPDETNQAVKDVVNSMEPLYCSPLGAMIDDAGYFFASDPNVLPSTLGGSTYSVAGNDLFYSCRPKIAMLISDGSPTAAFEFPAGTCGGNDAIWSPTNLASTETEFDCPWRSSVEEAGELYDLTIQIDPDADPIHTIAVGFNVEDVDCLVTPEDCVEVGPTYVPCYLGALPASLLLTPRQYLNEIACQGWPEIAEIQPPWLHLCDTASFESGNCDASSMCCKDERALFANSARDLATVMDLVISSFTATVATRTDVVTSNVVLPDAGAGTETVEQYEFNSGYIAQAGQPWQGILTRTDFLCDDTTGTTEVNDMAEALRLQALASNRRIYSHPLVNDPPKPLLSDDDYNNAIALSQVVEDPIAVEPLKIFDASEFDDCDIGMDVSYPVGCVDTTEVLKKVVPELYDQDGVRGLADIYNSTPDVLEPPRERLEIQSYAAYQGTEFDGQQASERNPFLFVGTNDGVLHAFDIFSLDDPGSDKLEAWGYMPRSLLRQVKDQFALPTIESVPPSYIFPNPDETGLPQHLFLMDGSPVAADVRLYRVPGGTVEDETKAWRALVFGGVGKGARTYYALDVTEALRTDKEKVPQLRWEISPDVEMYGNNEVDASEPNKGGLHFNKMGFPISKPKLAYPFFETQVDASNKAEAEVAVAILPGGWKSDPDETTGVYIVRMADGKLLRYLEPGEFDSTDICRDKDGQPVEEWGLEPGETAQLVGEPSIPFGTRTLKITSEAFIGDDRGRLWMIDLSSNNDPEVDQGKAEDGDAPDDGWCLRLYFDTLVSHHYPYQDCIAGECTDPEEFYAGDSCVHSDCCTGGPTGERCNSTMKAPRTPILAAPAIAQDENFQNIIVFGTGTYDSLTELNRNRIFSLTDKTSISALGEVIHEQPEINWWIGDWYLEGSTSPDRDNVPEKRQWIHDSMIATGTDATWVTFGDNSFFGVGEKTIGRATIFDGVAYYTTFSPLAGEGDACDAGASRTWGVDFDDRLGSNGVWETDPGSNDFGAFPTGGDTTLYQEEPNALFSSAKVVRRPTCFQPGNPFVLLVQRADPSFDPKTSPADKRPIVGVEIQLPKTTSQGVAQIRFDSWAIIFE